eukprot:SAG31_NODE_3364_length_4360_cov_2.281155_5_plen_68_part_01
MLDCGCAPEGFSRRFKIASTMYSSSASDESSFCLSAPVPVAAPLFWSDLAASTTGVVASDSDTTDHAV